MKRTVGWKLSIIDDIMAIKVKGFKGKQKHASYTRHTNLKLLSVFLDGYLSSETQIQSNFN